MTERRERLTNIKKVGNALEIGKKKTTKELAIRLGMSTRTVLRCIKDLKVTYKAKIDSHKRNGHSLNEYFYFPLDQPITSEELSTLKTAVETLNQFKHLDIFKNIEGLLEKIESSVRFNVAGDKNHIFFESVPNYKGTQHIPFFLDAIKKQRIVEFEYQSFTSDKIYLHKFCPYFLKEHTNRWYVIGELWLTDKKVISPYALERIIVNEKMRLTDQPFRVREGFSPTEHFNHTYGIAVMEESNVEDVILEFTIIQAKYFESKPFTDYQDISEEQNCTRVKIKIKPNKELIRKLASMGNGVKIIAPKPLKDKVVEYLELALLQY